MSSGGVCEETPYGSCSVGVAAPADLMESRAGPDPVSAWMGSQRHEVPKEGPPVQHRCPQYSGVMASRGQARLEGSSANSRGGSCAKLASVTRGAPRDRPQGGWVENAPGGGPAAGKETLRPLVKSCCHCQRICQTWLILVNLKKSPKSLGCWLEEGGYS